ncbi:MAG: hypothetical protein RR194_03925 [Ruthenibacterium sp.]
MQKLLILGAGGYGRTLCETAQALGIFEEIAFLDDRAQGALGVCADYARYAGEYACAYPAFGENALRMAWLSKLATAGYRVPALVHPRAFVSPSATVEDGAVVLANAAVGCGTVLRAGCIVNMGALVDHDCVIGCGAHLAPGVVVKAGNTVADGAKLESGTVLLRQNG